MSQALLALNAMGLEADRLWPLVTAERIAASTITAEQITARTIDADVDGMRALLAAAAGDTRHRRPFSQASATGRGLSSGCVATAAATRGARA